MTRAAGQAGNLPDKVVAALDRIARGVRAHRQAVATAAGITLLQADLVRTLADGTPPPALAGPLAAELGVSQPTVSDSLAALERKGFLTREETPGDRRRSTFTLTRAGKRLAADLAEADGVLRAGIDVLPEADQATALRVLLGLITGLLDTGVLAAARTCPTCRFFDDGDGTRCTLLGVELTPGDLRVDCADHQVRVSRAR